MLTVEVLELGPTATYAARTAVWVSNGSGEVDMPSGEIVPGLGKLTIRLRKAHAWWGRIETDTYAVQEIEPEQMGTRLFLLLNLTDPDQGEPYRVTVGGVNNCRCRAGLVGRFVCKHQDAIAALIAEGILEPELAT